MAVSNLSDSSIITGSKRKRFWDQISGPSGLILISTQDFSSVSAVTFDNVFSDSYFQYKVITSATGTTLAGINFQFRSNGSTYTTGNYAWAKLMGNGTSLTASRSTSQTNWQNALGAIDNNQGYSMNLEIFNPYQSVYTSGVNTHHYSQTGTHEIRSFSISVTNSFDGFYGYTSGGTMTGSISVYGYYKGA